MKRSAILLVVLGAACLFETPSQAQDGSIVGVWRQVRSNAGDCRTCQIEIEKGDASLDVRANNGWSGSVRAEPADDLITAAGGGRWRPGGTSPHSGKFFRLRLVSQNSRLYLLMSGTGFQVEAVFERAPPKSI